MSHLHNPWRALAHRDFITLIRAHLPAGERGRLYPDHDAIVLDKRLSQAEARCTLTHELVHLRRGDGECSDPVASGKQERRCEDEAARLLIPLDRLAAALLWGREPEEIADELWVDLDTLKARVASLTQEEKDYINSRVTAKGEVA